MKHIKALIFIISLLFLSFGLKYNISTTPHTLKGTTWFSQFYHYCNFYRFETDSTGYKESGQVAWSCPVDTLALGISGDHILYEDPVAFKYEITDTVLVIEYLDKNSNEDHQKELFYYRSEYKDWISKYEYTYGFEYLKEGEKRVRYDL